MVPARAHVAGHSASIVNVNGGMHFSKLGNSVFPFYCLTAVKINIKNLLKKSLAKQHKIVYAFLRYPISVSQTVLVQGVPSHAGRGKEQLVTFARIWTRRITNISLRRSLVEFR